MRPTKKDLKIANIFDTRITSEYVAAKVDFFLGSYVLFFALIYMLLELLGRVFTGGRTVIDKLARSASESGKFMQLDEHSKEDLRQLSKICLFDKALRQRQSAAHSRTVKKEQSEAGGDSVTGTGGAVQSRMSRVFSFLRGIVAPKTSKNKVYDDEFYSHILSKRCFFGCEAIVLPNGIDLYFFKVKPGIAEDYLLYICNNHSVLSCIYGVKGSSYSRSSRSLVFSLQHMCLCSLVALSNSVLAVVRAPAIAAPLVNTLLVPTCSPLLNKMFQWIFVVGSKTYVDKRLVALLCFTGGMSLLVFAALSTSSDSRYGIIASYSLQVIVSSFARELLAPLLLYSSKSYTGLLLCGWPQLQVGLHNYEVFLRDRIRKDKEYVAYSTTVLCVTVERIYKRKVTSIYSSSTVAASSDGDLYDSFGPAGPMTANPLLSQPGASKEGVELTAVAGASDSGSRETFSMENPMLALARSLSTSLPHRDSAAVAITVGEEEEELEEEQEQETEWPGGGLRSLIKTATLRLYPAQQTVPKEGDSSMKTAAKARPRRADVRSSFTEKVDFFENSAFLQRRASIRASIHSSAGEVQQLLRAAAAAPALQHSRVSSERLAAIASPIRNALKTSGKAMRPRGDERI